MMKTSIFTIAMIAMAASADQLLQTEVPPSEMTRIREKRAGERAANPHKNRHTGGCEEELNDDERFLQWAAQNNRNYGNNSEMNRKRRNWQDTDDYIKTVNAAADESGNPDALRLKHNNLSDMDAEERRNHFGRNAGNGGGRRGGRNLDDEAVAEHMESQRFLQASQESIDWVALGKVTPVKDQGNCGSCYAFGSNTTLESRIAIAENTTPVHLSEQELVDCSSSQGNNGCNGGLEIFSWAYQKQNGAVRASDYPYTSGNTGSGGSCQAAGKTDVARVDDYAWMNAGAAEIITALADGPVAIGIQGENQNFYNYSGGLLSASNCANDRIDHAVVVVGYEAGGEGTTETVTTTETWCRYQTWWDRRYYGGCRYWDETLWYNTYCCWEETTTETISTSGDAYFLVQNSWGTGWGENGFVRMAVEFSGDGACGMNTEPVWVKGHSV